VTKARRASSADLCARTTPCLRDQTLPDLATAALLKAVSRQLTGPPSTITNYPFDFDLVLLTDPRSAPMPMSAATTSRTVARNHQSDSNFQNGLELF
jgi:hypothetical protein